MSRPQDRCVREQLGRKVRLNQTVAESAPIRRHQAAQYSRVNRVNRSHLKVTTILNRRPREGRKPLSLNRALKVPALHPPPVPI